MQSSAKITCTVSASDTESPLGLEIWLDDQLILDRPSFADTMHFEHDFDDQDADHDLRFVLKNKNENHTRLDQDGNIIKDSCITIQDLSFDGINLGHLVVEKATYSHNFNGTGPATQEKFYGTMGCNGTVSLKFSTPIYLWLLENM